MGERATRSGGRPIGYLAGCLDPNTFPTEEERFEVAVRQHRLLIRLRPLAFFVRAGYDVLGARLRRSPPIQELKDERWPSHLHINVEREARGTGAADALMVRWLAEMAAAGSPGCYLQTLRENPRAIGFFARHGFAEHGPAPLCPG